MEDSALAGLQSRATKEVVVHLVAFLRERIVYICSVFANMKVAFFAWNAATTEQNTSAILRYKILFPDAALLLRTQLLERFVSAFGNPQSFV